MDSGDRNEEKRENREIIEEEKKIRQEEQVVKVADWRLFLAVLVYFWRRNAAYTGVVSSRPEYAGSM